MSRPRPQENLRVSMSFTVCAIRSPTFLAEKKSKLSFWRWSKKSFLSEYSIFLAPPIMKYRQPRRKNAISSPRPRM